MAKHRKQNLSTKRRVAAASAVVVGSTVMAPGMATAAEFTIPNTNFTSWAYQQAGVNIPRTSQAQAAGGTPVSLDALQPGDIIAYYGGASHVGIYTGHGTIIDALNAGSPVGERPLHFQPIHSAVRF